MLSRTIFFLILVLLCMTGAAYAQSGRSGNNTSLIDSMGADKSSPDAKGSDLGTAEEEMLARRAVKYAEKERQENLERAREVAQLGSELHDAFLKNGQLGRDDFKKLDRLEKAARKIRSAAGGSDDDAELKDAPQKLSDAMTRVADVSDTLRKGVEKTPRQVVSADVIERANELLEIIRFVRTFTR